MYKIHKNNQNGKTKEYAWSGQNFTTTLEVCVLSILTKFAQDQKSSDFKFSFHRHLNLIV